MIALLRVLPQILGLMVGLSADRKNLIIVLLAFGVMGTVGLQYVNGKHGEAVAAIIAVKKDTLHEVNQHETRYAESLRELHSSLDRIEKQQGEQWKLLVEIARAKR